MVDNIEKKECIIWKGNIANILHDEGSHKCTFQTQYLFDDEKKYVNKKEKEKKKCQQ